MLSYRHAFHAGNHADVLKHVALVAVLRHLQRKDKPISVIDTHAGAGFYPLDAEWTARLAEYERGIGALWGRAVDDPLVSDYLALVATLGGGVPEGSNAPAVYPGSPAIAHALQRPADRLTLFELHPDEFARLEARFGRAPRVAVRREDGFAGAIALAPPTPRRGLVLVDPPYEVGEDYRRVIATVRAVHRRWSTAVQLVWYPLLARARDRSRLLRDGFTEAELPATLDLRFCVARQAPDLGMHGSGLLIVNTPWQLDEALGRSVGVLQDHLAAPDAPAPEVTWLTAPT